MVRHGRRNTGSWVEIPLASVFKDGTDVRIYLPLVPVTGFDGHILLRPVDAETEEFPQDPEEEDEDPVETP